MTPWSAASVAASSLVSSTNPSAFRSPALTPITPSLFKSTLTPCDARIASSCATLSSSAFLSLRWSLILSTKSQV